MPYVDYFANSPLMNWAQLHAGPGDVPLRSAAAAYAKIGEALGTAANGTQASTIDLANGWDGLGSERAQAAFRNHSSWVLDQADLAGHLARIAESAAQDNLQAKSSMPSLGEIIAVMQERQRARLGLLFASGTGLGVVASGVAAARVVKAELAYLDLRRRAAQAMATYEARATGTVREVLAIPIQPPPPIVNGPDTGAQLLNRPGSDDHTGVLNELLRNGPDTRGGPEVQDGTGKPGGERISDPTTTDPGQISDPGQDLPPELTDSMVQDLVSHSDPSQIGPELLEQDQLFGTSPTSPTLAAMSGGVGSLVGLGMLGGGLGSMAGASTGFRMPPNWRPGTGMAFGAGTGATGSAPLGRPVNRPAVSAPTARMRRRRKEDEDKPGKVFAPGEHIDVPVLERPPAIGVIEYEPDDELMVDDTEASLVGVLERLDSDSDRDDPQRHEPH